MTIDTDELRRKISSVDIVDHVDIHANVKPLLAELLDRLEAAEKERDVLRDRLALESQENGALRDSVDRACEERAALRAEVIHWKEQKEPGAAGWRALARLLQAKVKEMEKQKPVATVIKKGAERYWMSERMGTLPDGTHSLYLGPGAKGERE